MKKKNLSIRLWIVVSEPGGAKSTTLITRDLFGGGDFVESGWEKRLDLRNIFCKCQFFCLCEYWFTLKFSVWFLRKCRNRKWKFKTTSFNVYVKKRGRVSAGFTRVARVDPPGRPGFAGPTPRRVFTKTRTGPMPGSAGSRVDPPGRSGF